MINLGDDLYHALRLVAGALPRHTDCITTGVRAAAIMRQYCKLDFHGLPELRTDRFEKPRLPGDQMELFWDVFTTKNTKQTKCLPVSQSA